MTWTYSIDGWIGNVETATRTSSNTNANTNMHANMKYTNTTTTIKVLTEQHIVQATFWMRSPLRVAWQLSRTQQLGVRGIVVYGKQVIAVFFWSDTAVMIDHYHHKCWDMLSMLMVNIPMMMVMMVMICDDSHAYVDDDSCHHSDVWIVTTMLTDKNPTNSLNLEHAKIKEITSTPFLNPHFCSPFCFCCINKKRGEIWQIEWCGELCWWTDDGLWPHCTLGK